MEKNHVGMNGDPCRCTPERREEFTRDCLDVCPCHGVAHAACPGAKPCIGGCGRLTTAFETQVPGYCPHCAADDGWTPLEDC